MRLGGKKAEYTGVVAGMKTFFPDLPLNSGFYRPISIIAPFSTSCEYETREMTAGTLKEKVEPTSKTKVADVPEMSFVLVTSYGPLPVILPPLRPG